MHTGTQHVAGKDLLFADTPRGRSYLSPDNVFIRASDGRVLVGNGDPLAGLHHLSDEEAAMVVSLDRVQQVGVVKVGA